MPNVQRNLIIGGMDIRLNEHNTKGFCVKVTKNLRYNLGHVTALAGLVTLATLVPDETPENHDNQINQVSVP